MATIQNSAIIQKLIDELELYPALDKVPTELADKILPVFQVNSEEISLKTPTANVVKSLNKWAVNSVAGDIYTTPATGKFFLTNVWINPSVSTDLNWHMLITIDGVATKILSACSIAVTDALGKDCFQSLNLQNPILVDANTKIQIQADQENAGHFLDCGIVGYTESD